MLKFIEEQYDEYKGLNLNHTEQLKYNFHRIKLQNNRFKNFIEAFRENEKEFSIKLKTLKVI